MEKHIKAPIEKQAAAKLKAGDYVYITGTIYTARDAAHKRMYEALSEGKELPVDIQKQMIYYMGRLRQERGVRSDPQVRQRQAAWINMRHSFWIPDLEL